MKRILVLILLLPAASFAARWQCIAGYLYDYIPLTYTAQGGTRALAAAAALRRCRDERIAEVIATPCELFSCREVPQD